MPFGELIQAAGCSGVPCLVNARPPTTRHLLEMPLQLNGENEAHTDLLYQVGFFNKVKRQHAQRAVASNCCQLKGVKLPVLSTGQCLLKLQQQQHQQDKTKQAACVKLGACSAQRRWACEHAWVLYGQRLTVQQSNRTCICKLWLLKH